MAKINIIPFLLILVVLILSGSSSSKANTSNVLLTGQTLSNQSRLSYAYKNSPAFIMQLDCNLVLYDGFGLAKFHSNTAGIGSRNCILSFTNNGRLVVRNPSGRQMWITPNANSKVGNYAAVLRPDGQVYIYGPAVWSTGAVLQGSSDNNLHLENAQLAYNLLFSGQVLYGDGKLSDNGYSLIMKEDCDLVLEKSGGVTAWRTWTRGNGENCFARLNHKGELAIKDDDYNSVWSNWRAGGGEDASGEYVLIMQQNGNAVIYGPVVWSTAHPNNGLIRMPTAAAEK